MASWPRFSPREVFALLLEEELISETQAEKIAGWLIGGSG